MNLVLGVGLVDSIVLLFLLRMAQVVGIINAAAAAAVAAVVVVVDIDLLQNSSVIFVDGDLSINIYVVAVYWSMPVIIIVIVLPPLLVPPSPCRCSLCIPSPTNPSSLLLPHLPRARAALHPTNGSLR